MNKEEKEMARIPVILKGDAPTELVMHNGATAQVSAGVEIADFTFYWKTKALDPLFLNGGAGPVMMLPAERPADEKLLLKAMVYAHKHAGDQGITALQDVFKTWGLSGEEIEHFKAKVGLAGCH